MTTTPLIIFTTTLLLLLPGRHHSSTATASSSDLLHQTCKNISSLDRNIHYSFCVAALQSAPASHCADLPRLGLLSLRLVKDNVTDTRCRIKGLLKDKSAASASAKAALKDCLGLYSDAVETVREAMVDYKGGKYFEASLKVSSVMDAAVTCEDGFKDGGVDSPLTRWNGFTFQISAVALSIMNSLRAASF